MLTGCPASSRMSSCALRDSAWLWWSVVLCAVLVAGAPLLVTDLPPLGDYSNHLARMYVIMHVQIDPVLARIYEVAWNVVPNLAMDLVVPPLAHVVPLDIAGRIFIALAMLLPVAGVLTLHRVAFGTRSFWPLASLLVAYNGLFFWGFLNFVAGLGLALLGSALWLREPTQGGMRHLAIVTIFAVVLFFCHLEALALFGITIGCIELVRLFALRRAGQLTLAAVACRALRLAVPFIIPVLLFLFVAPLGEGVTGKPLLLQIKEYYWAVCNGWRDGKLAGLGIPFTSGHSPLLDGLAAISLAMLYLLQILRHGCRVNAGLLLAAALLMLAYPVVPAVWLTAANIDSRLPVFAVLLVLAGVAPNGTAVPAVRAGSVLFAALLAARVALVAYVWVGSNAETAAFRRLIQAVAPGERVIVVDDSAAVQPPSFRQRIFFHAEPGVPVPLLTMDRQAFWPTLFTSRTLQPVHVLPPYLAISVEQSMQPSTRALIHPTVRDLQLTPYVRNWRQDFDYVLLVGAAAMPPEPALGSDVLRRVDATNDAVLFAIRK